MPPKRTKKGKGFDAEAVRCWGDIHERSFMLCSIWEQVSHARRRSDESQENVGQIIKAELEPVYDREVKLMAADLKEAPTLGVPKLMIEDCIKRLPEPVQLAVLAIVRTDDEIVCSD